MSSRLIGMAIEDIEVSDSEYPDEQLLPAGLHEAVAVEITEGRNEDRGEDWVKVVFQITSGDYSGCTVTDWWRYGGSAAAEEISDKKFKSLMTLCSVKGALVSLDQLTMQPIMINNKHYVGKNDGVKRNTINYYKKAGSATNQVAMNQSTPVQQAPVQQAPVQQAAPQMSPPPLPPQQVAEPQQQVPLQQAVAQEPTRPFS